MGMVIDSFIDPYSRAILRKDSDGNLYYRNKDVIHLYRNYDGIYDFVLEGSELWKEREHYDKEYSAGDPYELTQDLIRDVWYVDIYPWRKTILDSLGELKNKKILLLGNGDSYKEFYFLDRGARLVFTDLSLEAVEHMQKKFAASSLYETYREKVEFHVVDAYNLPFHDGDFDIIYGTAFTHHLDNLNPFLSEVYRCLKRNGICRFSDGADAPLWRSLKTILYPLKKYSHWRHPRSPEDLRAERRQGYTLEKMAALMKDHNFRDMIFLREWFFLRIVGRHYGMFFNYSPKAIRRAHKLLLLLKLLDKNLAHTKWMQRNQLVLIWGFTK